MPPVTTLRDVLKAYHEGEITLEEAERLIEGLRIEMVGDLARIDLGRSVRCGMPEVVLAEGKTAGQLSAIVMKYARTSGRCIVTRISDGAATVLAGECERAGMQCTHSPLSGTMIVSTGERGQPHGGVVGIITAGTSDIPVAEEARVIAEEMGCRVHIAYDVGAAGIHRLFPALKDLLDAHVFIVAAGREGTLPAIVAGLVDRPVIGVPVSTGYGYMGKGEAALASMLQSCAAIAVVNIDAGFTAGAIAARIAGMVATHE